MLEKFREYQEIWDVKNDRGDQIEVFKILNGYENIDSNLFSSK